MATKTTKKTTQATETKKEFTLERALVMWIYKGKKGGKYLSGKTEDGDKIKGFFNSKKNNPKEPDIRIYGVNEKGDLTKDEICSLWCNTTENGKKYATGKMDGDRVVGFFNSKAQVDGVVPYLNVYYSDDQKNEEQQKIDTKEEYEEVETDDDLPF